MCGSMVDNQSAAAEIRRGIKKEDRKKPQGKNIMSASATQGGHNKECTLIILTQITRQDWETEVWSCPGTLHSGHHATKPPGQAIIVTPPE